MEFLLLWVLSENILDSGMRFEDAGGCYVDSQNSEIGLREIGLTPTKFTFAPVAKGRELKLVVPAKPRSTFPLIEFSNVILCLIFFSIKPSPQPSLTDNWRSYL